MTMDSRRTCEVFVGIVQINLSAINNVFEIDDVTVIAGFAFPRDHQIDRLLCRH